MCKTRLVSILLAITLAAGCQTIRKPDWSLPEGVKVTWANGYPMAYMERGSGPTVVFVHGATLDYRYWIPQVESLSSRFRVISVSLRHYYPEPWNGKGEFSLKVHADDVAAFIDQLDGPVHLVGHSRGGPVALAAALARPERVKKLVLMDPALFSLLPGNAGAAADEVRTKRARATQTYFERGEMEGGLTFFFEDINGAGSWSKLPESQRALRRENAWTIVGQLGDAEFMTCRDMGSLRMPVLVMEGERSPKTFKSVAEAARKCLPAPSAATIPNAGHQMNQHNPAAFDAALTAFLLR